MGLVHFPDEGPRLVGGVDLVGLERAVADHIPVGGNRGARFGGGEIVWVVPDGNPPAVVVGLASGPEANAVRFRGSRLYPVKSLVLLVGGVTHGHGNGLAAGQRRRRGDLEQIALSGAGGPLAGNLARLNVQVRATVESDCSQAVAQRSQRVGHHGLECAFLVIHRQVQRDVQQVVVPVGRVLQFGLGRSKRVRRRRLRLLRRAQPGGRAQIQEPTRNTSQSNWHTASRRRSAGFDPDSRAGFTSDPVLRVRAAG